MPGPANLIKAQIKQNLDALVTGGTLGAVVEMDLNPDIFDTDLPGYPCAVLGTSRMEAQYEYSQANRRKYIFDILVIQLLDNLTSMGDMEDLRDNVALQFDNNVTLSGAAPICVEAVYSERLTYASKGKNFVLFNVTIKASTLVGLQYNF